MDEQKWQNKFNNFELALGSLEKATQRPDLADQVIQAGIIQNFEFTLELLWKTLKQKLEFEGFNPSSPRETIKTALQANWLSQIQAKTLLDSLDFRNLLSHTYNQTLSREAVDFIIQTFLPICTQVYDKIRTEQN